MDIDQWRNKLGTGGSISNGSRPMSDAHSSSNMRDGPIKLPPASSIVFSANIKHYRKALECVN